jgi:glycosyltransferase involved in cell wall biosynthesis
MAQNVSSVFKMTMIVPCYNEGMRLDLNYWNHVIDATKDIKWIFVDDGSSDNTSELLSEIRGGEVRRLTNNLGKAEALRWGFREAISQESEVLGYIDADQSFNKDEVVQMCTRFKQRTEWTSSNQNYIAVFMSRSSLLNGAASLGGTFRKLIGTLVSKINSAVWSELPSDTQCGFKFFRVNDKLLLALHDSFPNSWFFEIELLIRIRRFQDNPLVINVVPLNYCFHVKGSSTDKINTLNSVWQIVNVLLKLISFRRKCL